MPIHSCFEGTQIIGIGEGGRWEDIPGLCGAEQKEQENVMLDRSRPYLAEFYHILQEEDNLCQSGSSEVNDSE
ncbi:jg8909 [Pararge aegeria aegeria]|uniref:Jg8909 protein n=1 Tax=Pararge aegeria aegeria TaxID=348720 RepID=A0A8S4SN07_9NEOP|nr:jg8909 [Pararge aegeria aegeria]